MRESPEPFERDLAPVEILQRRLLATLIAHPEKLYLAVSLGAGPQWFASSAFLLGVWNAVARQGAKLGAFDFATILAEITPLHPSSAIRSEFLDLMQFQSSESMLRAYCTSLRGEESKAKALGSMTRELPATTAELATALEAKAHEFMTLSRYAKADSSERPEDLLNQTEREIERVREHGSFGLSCGIVPLDMAFRGWRPGELIVCGARPSVGKSSFAVTVLDAVKRDDPARNVLYASVEMRAPDVAKRILACRSGVAVSDIESANPKEHERSRWEDALRFYREFSLDVRHQGMGDAPAIAAAARESKLRRGRLDLIVVDHMHIMRGAGKTDTERLTSVSKSLVALAHDLEVPVLALAQLNRQVEHREDPLPTLADLRGSGSIEEDGDMIFFLHRPSRDDRSSIIATIAKNRRGALTSCELLFDAPTSRFTWSGPKMAEAWSP